MEIRINKFLSEAGVCSRRAADKLIEDGRVTVDGVTAVMGTKVSDGQEVRVNGKIVKKIQDTVILAFHKPVGIVCTAEKREKMNVIDYIGYDKRIYPVGRLDKDSQGLLLLTNDGDLMNDILKAANCHEKEYLVTVDKEVTEAFIYGMANGVPVLDRISAKCLVEKTGKYSFRIILTQGLNRQIRRMCEYFGYHVRMLKRVRIMNITLDGLESGKYRLLTEKEETELRKLIKNGKEKEIENGKRTGTERRYRANQGADSTVKGSGKGVLRTKP
jgi:23S rRNA pseudouridine2604 synthase